MWQITLTDGTIIKGNREEVAKELNFMEDVYDDEIWDKFIELHPSYEIKRVEDNINATLTKQCEDKEDEDDLVF